VMRFAAFFAPLLLVVAGCPGKPKPTTAPSDPTPVAAARTQTDVIATDAGELGITPIKHAAMMMTFGGKHFFFDPWKEGDFTGLPKADVVFLTDIHPDHYDPEVLAKVRTPSTIVVAPQVVADKEPGVVVMKNGDTRDVAGVKVEAIPMYNLTRGPEEGKLFHDKGRGNGYVLTFGGKRVYVSGDTECIDEMKALQNIDVAFVCMNLPYTMTPAEAAACVDAFKPKIVFPFHYRESNTAEFASAIAKDAGIEVRQREWYPK
ncbi:MAG: MBL fold metallo-hydrolase, partial [Polyangiales bacterium]